MVKFFYEPYYTELITSNPLPFNPNINKDLIKQILLEFVDTLNLDVPEQIWFGSLKELGTKYNFANNAKEYKKNPTIYNGHIGDVAEMIRIALTSSKQSPNLYYILRILGNKEVSRRIKKVIELIK